MIPNNITKEHIEKAIKEIDRKGIQKGAHSSTYDIVYNEKRYPPKLVVSLANKYANGVILPRDTFQGGEGTPAFQVLERLGFQIDKKIKSQSTAMENVKQEFAQWLLQHAPVSYKSYLGATVETIIIRLEEINDFFQERDIFLVDRENHNELINYIKLKNSKIERIKNKDFYDYDRKHSRGIPIAILGKENYSKFLKEKFELKAISYWVFQGNPRSFDYETALKQELVTEWTVSAHKDKIKVGDKVILWITGDNSGCYALAEVTSEPHERTSSQDDHLWKEDDKSELKADIKITHNLVASPILKEIIDSIEELKDLKVGNQGTNFSATRQEYNTLLKMAETNRFSWVKTHIQLSQYLLDKENQQQELIQLLKTSGVTGFKDQDENDKTIELNEIDPFTFYSYINKYGPKKSLQVLQKIAKLLDLSYPNDVSGIPSTQPIQVHIFPWQKDRNNEINRLWNFFQSALNKNISDDDFEDILKIGGVGHTKLTEILFYVDPENYFPINGPTKPYLQQVFKINPRFNSYREYMSILNQIKSKTDKPFYQLSSEAWLWNDSQKNNEEKDFKNRIKNSNPSSLQIYFQLLDQLFSDLKIEDSENIVFSTGSNQLSFQIGKRYCLNLKKDKFYFIAPKDYEVKDSEKGLFAEPDVASYIKNVSNNEVVKHYDALFKAVRFELERDNHTKEKEYDNGVFRKAVFDKEYRETFFEFSNPTIDIPKNTKDTSMALNTILFGPPGTGKTYNSINKALEIINEKEEQALDWDDRIAVKQLFDKRVGEGRIVFSTFHQSMSYEDFIEGIKPITYQNKVIYKVVPGIFKTLCEGIDYFKVNEKFGQRDQYKISKTTSQIIRIERDSGIVDFSRDFINELVEAYIDGTIDDSFFTREKRDELRNKLPTLWDKYLFGYDGMYKAIIEYVASNKGRSSNETLQNKVIIIDEINRGNISSIFGEIITLIESNKRAGEKEEIEIILPYSKETFKVPPNVYIIGTMNTADRSIEALDTALRRRFSFIELPPDSSLIKSKGKLVSTNGKIGQLDVVKLLDTINTRIEKLIDKDHKIGHSYFLKVYDEVSLKKCFKNEVIPLLEEYFFGDYGKIGLVLGDSFLTKDDTEVFEFAEFEGYDSDVSSDLKERPVYKIRPSKDWDFNEI